MPDSSQTGVSTLAKHVTHLKTIMFELLQSLQDLLIAIWGVIAALGQLAIRHWFLLAWISYFTFAVHWARAFEVLGKGAWVAASLVCLAAMAVFSMMSRTGPQQASVFGWDVHPIAGTVVVGITYLAIAFVCGSIQMSGLPARVLNWFERRSGNVVRTD